MANLNRVMLMGNLTRDVEVRYLQTGTAVADVSLAVSDRRKSAQGEWIEETTFVDVTMWGRTAEVAGEYLGKGSPVFIEGRLKLDTWETDGQKRSKLKVICERMQMIGGRGAAAQRSNGDVAHEASPTAYSEPEPAISAPAGTPRDDIPF